MTGMKKEQGAALRISVLVVAILTVVTTSVFAAPKYPDKPVTLVVCYAPGGTADLNARKLAIYLKKYLGESVTVVNKPGAAAALGTKFVYDADADGYTILYSAENPGTFQAMGTSTLSYNDFIPIDILLNDPKIVVVSGDSKYKTMAELADDIKARPGKVRMSHSGPGGSGHIQGLLYAKADLKIAMTSFGGGNPALLAVLGNQVEFTNANLSSVVEYLRSGKMRGLAMFSTERNSLFPDIPAITDAVPALAGYLPLPFPQSILVKKGTPDEVVAVLRKAMKDSFADPEWKAHMSSNNLEPLYEYYKTPAQISTFFSDWTSLVSWMLYEDGVAPNNPEKFGIAKPAK